MDESMPRALPKPSWVSSCRAAVRLVLSSAHLDTLELVLADLMLSP